MSDESPVPETTDPPAKSAQTKQAAREEMLKKVQKARESRMRHQSPEVDADGAAQKPSRSDKGYSGRPAPRGSSKGGSNVRRRDPAG